MAPNGDAVVVAPTPPGGLDKRQKPRRISMEGLQRAMSDLAFELTKDKTKAAAAAETAVKLQPISEQQQVEDARCECCGMSEECTPDYVRRVRDKYSGRWICGLCTEAVKEETEKNGGRKEEALNTHMSVCGRFNRVGRANPVLVQAEAMREILRKRSQSNSPRERTNAIAGKNQIKGSITRSSSCIPFTTKNLN